MCNHVVTQPFKRQSGHAVVSFKTACKIPVKSGVVEGTLRIRYAPDQAIIEKKDFVAFLESSLQHPWQTLEEFTDGFIAKFYDALVPFSVEGQLTIKTDGLTQHITAQKQQPQINL